MKRILPLVFLLALLCGCKNTDPGLIPPSTDPATEETQPGTHISGSEIEKQSIGAIRQYATEGEIAWIAPFGEDVLLASAGETTTLTVLSGERGVVVATVQLSLKLSEEDTWQVTDQGFAYYNRVDKRVYYLDKQLSTARAVQLPDAITADPVITADCMQIFYCEGQNICSMDADRKLSRPVRTVSCQSLTLDNSYRDGTLLRCNVQGEDGRWYHLYISAQNGETVYEEKHVKALYTAENRYFAVCADGAVTQYLFGTIGQKQRLVVPGQVYVSPALSGAMGLAAGENSTTLSYYSLESCKRIAELFLPIQFDCQTIVEAGSGVWMLTGDGKVMRWDIAVSAVTEDTIYTGTIYTADFTDSAGLENCEQRAEAMSSTYGVDIRVWLQAQLDDEVIPEYQVETINNALDALETVFAKFPENFLSESAINRLHVYIVREADGDEISACRWKEGNPYILLCPSENVTEAFLRVFSYVLDVHVLGNSSRVDDWASMNPEGFTYGDGDVDSAYLAGQTQAFANADAAKSVADDRASIFYYAMQSGNEAMFQAPIMQQKLLIYCKAIRDAWGLKKSPETFLWEQYLTESIAYK